MTLENAASALTLLGIGGLLGNYFRILWERKNSALLQKQDYKETRYKCIIILMISLLDFERSRFLLQQNNRGYIKTPEDLLAELRVEWNNMLLFAPKEVLKHFGEFIQSPSGETFRVAAIAMRQDLWGGSIDADALRPFIELR